MIVAIGLDCNSFAECPFLSWISLRSNEREKTLNGTRSSQEDWKFAWSEMEINFGHFNILAWFCWKDSNKMNFAYYLPTNASLLRQKYASRLSTYKASQTEVWKISVYVKKFFRINRPKINLKLNIQANRSRATHAKTTRYEMFGQRSILWSFTCTCW